MADETLTIRKAEDCRWDCAALGEVMLRFDPGSGRVRNARSFEVWEGGGEYNVARALRKCFGQRATHITALPINDLGWLVEDRMLQGGVDTSHLIWREFDGVGRSTRVGLNFTEKGFGIRPALGLSDRGHTAASQIRPGEVNWNRLFGEEGVRWFHTGGIFAGLASNTAEAVIEAVEAARRHGTVVSYDLNYRASLWKSQGGQEAAQRINREIARSVDVMVGATDHFSTCLGVSGVDVIAAARAQFPNFKVTATTLRNARSATLNDWSAELWADGSLSRSVRRDNLEIFDRVGGGDAFVSGMAYAFLEGLGPQAAVDYGAAHAALAMTTPGDSSMMNAAEVAAAITATDARANR